MTSMYIDGEVYLADAGVVERFVGGSSGGWSLAAPGDDVLRPTVDYTLIDSPDPRRQGTLYVFDAANARVLAFDKLTGAYLAQYRPAGGSQAWSQLRDFYIQPRSPGQAPAIYWIDGTTLGTAILQPVTPAPSGAPSASPGSARRRARCHHARPGPRASRRRRPGRPRSRRKAGTSVVGPNASPGPRRPEVG